MVSLHPSPVLVRKYNQPAPRYTSYPTVPFWQEQIAVQQWGNAFREKFSTENNPNGISLYIHLPFCESLCTYCGCNKKITANHKVEEEYLAVLEKEWMLYRGLMSEPPLIRQLHIGGGTPTFFSPVNLERLINIFLRDSRTHPFYEFSIEGHPNNTTAEHLRMLYRLGFRRISYGVQDNDPVVQRIINRIQPLENVRLATENARIAGFTSINFDLIYGLPLQTVQSIRNTIRQVIDLSPDRIAFYSYAHVPWTSRGQRLFDETDLPAAEEKLRLYLEGKELLTGDGYTDIGMDHFARPADELNQARVNGTLHRNFMGYTSQQTGLLLGLGVSAISDLGDAFAQNSKTLHEYYESVQTGELAIRRGYFLNGEDVAFRKYILDISCKGMTEFRAADRSLLEAFAFPKLREFEQDGLLHYDQSGLTLTGTGYFFLRNICSAFDLHMQRTNGKKDLPLFSKAI